MAKHNKGFARVDRVNEQILRELAELIRKELKDPRAGLVTLTEVDVTRDYAHAKIYFTVLTQDSKQETIEVLERASGFLRRELGKRITLFHTPQLHFVYDESVERGMNLSQLIDQVAEEFHSEEQKDDQ